VSDANAESDLRVGFGGGCQKGRAGEYGDHRCLGGECLDGVEFECVGELHDILLLHLDFVFLQPALVGTRGGLSKMRATFFPRGVVEELLGIGYWLAE
jgi:hypothetical protein